MWYIEGPEKKLKQIHSELLPSDLFVQMNVAVQWTGPELYANWPYIHSGCNWTHDNCVCKYCLAGQNVVGHGLLCVDVIDEVRDRCQLGIATRVEVYLNVPSVSMVGGKDDTLMFEPGLQRYFGLHMAHHSVNMNHT